MMKAQDYSVEVDNKSAPRRGRPRRFDVDQATGVAQALFHAHGFDHVGVTRLAKEIGIEQPSLYAAFGNKLGVFKAAVERYAASEGAFIADALAGSETVEEGLRALLMAAAVNYSREGASCGCLIMEGAHATFDDGARAICAGKRAATHDILAAYVENSHAGLGDEIATMVMITLAGLSASARSGVGTEPLLGFARLAADGLADRIAQLAAPSSSD